MGTDLTTVSWWRKHIFFLEPKWQGSIRKEKIVHTEAIQVLHWFSLTTNAAWFFYFFYYTAGISTLSYLQTIVTISSSISSNQKALPRARKKLTRSYPSWLGTSMRPLRSSYKPTLINRQKTLISSLLASGNPSSLPHQAPASRNSC